MSRRLIFALLTALALLAVACSSPPSSGGGGEPVASGGSDGTDGGEEGPSLPECPLAALDEATGTTEVRLWYGGLGGETEQAMKDMATGFNAANAAGDGPKIEVTPNNRGRSYFEVQQAFESAASGDKSQLPAIVYLEDNALLAMANGGLVLPAQSCMEADDFDITDIVPAVRASYSVDDILWPGYMNVSTPVLYYNKVHFVKAGLDPDDPPTTMAEVRAAAEKIKAAGVAPLPFTYKRNAWFFTQWVNGSGAELLSGDNGRDLPAGEVPTAAFDNPEALETLEWLKGMKDDGLLADFEAEGGPTGIDHYLTLLPDANGKSQASMLIETSTAATTIKGVLAGTLTGEDAGIDFDESVIDRSALVPGTGPFPGLTKGGQVAPGGGAFYIVNAGTPAQQAAAWKFLRYMLEPEQVFQWHSIGGYLPTTKSMEDLPELEDFWVKDLAGVLLQPGTEQLATADPDEPSPLIGPYLDYADAVQTMLDKVLLSDADPQAALTEAAESVDVALERYGA